MARLLLLSLVALALCAVVPCALALPSDGNLIPTSQAADLATAKIPDHYDSIAAAVVVPGADAVVFTAATDAGWNAQQCPNAPGFRPAGKGACTKETCALGGAPAKFQTCKLIEDSIGYVLFSGSTNPTTTVQPSAEGCCTLCAQTPNCAFWQFIPTKLSNVKFGKDRISSSGGGCFLEDRKMALNCGDLTISYDTTSVDNKVKIKSGGFCNDDASAINDPHFTGAQGTRFDFNGRPNKAFCLLSDANVHVNMALRGYFDSRTEGASLIANGKAVRTWIRALAVLFKGEAKHEEHSLVLTARDGKSQERGDGYLKSIVVDGAEVPRLALGETYTGPAGVKVTLVAFEKAGKFDVDYYTVEVAGVIKLDVRLRVAHPLLQTPDDAETHINVGITDIVPTGHIHGVLGQTYRADHTQRSVDFQKVVALLHHPIAADTEEGEGFLDGHPEMYEVSDVTSTDCVFSAFGLNEKAKVTA